MPKAKDKTRKRRVDTDDDEIPASQQTQGRRKGQKQRQQHADDDENSPSPTQKNQLSGAELDRKVAETTRYLLFADRKKIPIKRADITKHVLKEHSKAFSQVMELSTKQLHKVFGIELVEVEGSGKAKVYMLLDKLDREEMHEMLDWGDESPRMGLLMLVLSVILMSDNIMNEASLWHFLKKMGLEPKKEHEVFGDPEKLIAQEFTRQGYLERRKVTGGEEATFEYSWGSRSNKELTKRKVLEFVSEIYGTDIEVWTSQLKDIEDEEQEGVEVMEIN
ncbi:non-structural maintenance of chromosomes element 3 homolog [Nematostella vectensis]|uniref:non-structural maintenance of chromosomes element 3 homolog n=1 Tax=Nematostella vectensis TaxID=45351 RepID=UPI00207786EA|nr:non-structural maintenance of chromosomes element 3 homolog [Nematostella vectensis]